MLPLGRLQLETTLLTPQPQHSFSNSTRPIFGSHFTALQTQPGRRYKIAASPLLSGVAKACSNSFANSLCQSYDIRVSDFPVLNQLYPSASWFLFELDPQAIGKPEGGHVLDLIFSELKFDTSRREFNSSTLCHIPWPPIVHSFPLTFV